MQPILQTIEDFIGQLPPLLQLLFGIFAGLASFKLFAFIVDWFEDRAESNKQ